MPRLPAGILLALASSLAPRRWLTANLNLSYRPWSPLRFSPCDVLVQIQVDDRRVVTRRQECAGVADVIESVVD